MSNAQTIGNRPQDGKSCPPDGSHLWATITRDDGFWNIVQFNGWLVATETSTNDDTIKDMIVRHYEETL